MKVHGNWARTGALLAVPSAAIVVVGAQWGWVGVGVAAVVAGGAGAYVLVCSGTTALRAMRAYPVSEADHPSLYRAVRELAPLLRVPMPRIYVSPTRAANAFATGRNPGRAAICCTEGLLALLDERELRAIVAHELVHIRRHDTLTSGAAGTVASVIMMAALRPIAAATVRLVSGPGREYRADVEAVRITGDPLALAAALRKLEASSRTLVLPAERDIIASSHQMIATPLDGRGAARMFSSHPPIGERVARLEQLGGYRRHIHDGRGGRL